MTDEDLLLRAIGDDPDDDGPRLAFADWLEGRGDPRGEFIRLQCELHEMPHDTPGWTVKASRAGILQWLHGSTWCRWSTRDFTMPPSSCSFVRGFPDDVTLRGQKVILEFNASVDEVFRPFLLRGLGVDGPVEAPIFRALVGLPHLRHLRRLTLRAVRPDGLRALADSPHLINLTSLSLRMNADIGAGDVRVLLESPSLPRLSMLDLCGTHSSVSVPTESWNPWDPMNNYETMLVRTSTIGLAGVRALAESPGASRLRRLDLSSNDIGDDGARALLDSPYLTQLSSLTLHDETIGPTAREALRARFGDIDPSPKGTVPTGRQ